MEKRRLGRLEHMSSVLIFGGAALSEVSEEEADRAISASLEAGINHFDTAAGYGDGNSEKHLGRWMPDIRDDIFLSTKVEEREKDAARRSIEASLERLRSRLRRPHTATRRRRPGRPRPHDRKQTVLWRAAVKALEENLVGCGRHYRPRTRHAPAHTPGSPPALPV